MYIWSKDPTSPLSLTPKTRIIENVRTKSLYWVKHSDLGTKYLT